MCVGPRQIYMLIYRIGLDEFSFYDGTLGYEVCLLLNYVKCCVNPVVYLATS